MMSTFIKHLFSCESHMTVTNVSEKVGELTKALINWTKGSCAKQVIVTIGGLSPKGNNHVREVTQKLLDRKLNKIYQKFTEVNKEDAYYDYLGTVGIRKNCLIVNLPGLVEFAKYCLEKLVDYVETIVHVLEK